MQNQLKGLTNHIVRKSGSAKTVCVSHVLARIGVPITAYQSTFTRKSGNVAPSILRRNGFAVRSRMSSIPKGASVGKARAAIAKLKDPAGTLYMTSVSGHLILLDANGQTIVDTAPRKRDARKVYSIYAVWRA
jgi:hypothetical protein